jgi:hypothetical protein
MEKRYRILRFVAGFWKVLAWIVLVLGILGSFGGLLMGLIGLGPEFWRGLGLNPNLFGGAVMGISVFFGGLIGTALQFLTLYAAGEVLSLFIAMEENTRATQLELQALRQAVSEEEPYDYESAPSYPQSEA